MDPTACYLIILEAFREHDYARAREYALILRNWLEAGGFYPKGFQSTDVYDLLGKVLRPACSASTLRFPFRSLACNHCDRGREVDSLTEAIDEGWYRIDLAVDRPGLSHIGICPACRKQMEEDDR